MILDSVAVMLILDLDEKSYSFVYGIARTPCLKLAAYLAEICRPLLAAGSQNSAA